MEPLDPFPAITLIASFFVFLLVAAAYCFGLASGEKSANKDAGKRIVAAFDDGYKQGLREATPKHDARGRFTHTA